jgi:EmrB/QacA subfamily drug resistance transporter
MGIGDTTPARGFRVHDVIRHGAEPPPLKFIARWPSYPWLIVGITCIGAFLGQLDASIVQLALPTLATVFHASLETVSWVALAYFLAFAAFLPIFDRLCELFGRKLLYLSGFLLFTLATTLCGSAANLAWLVFFRVLQGVGGSLLGANSISILVTAVSQARRGRALGIFAAAQAVGLSVGPAVGGVLVDAYGWRWVFWVTVPFGVAAIVLGWLTLPQTAYLPPSKVFDWRGALLLAPALIALIFALNQVSALGPTSPLLLACFAAFIVLMALLVRQERAFASPLVHLRLFSTPAFACGAGGVVLGYALLYGMFFLMSFALVRGYHESASLAGLKLAIIPVAIGIVAPFSGALADRLGPRLIGVGGMGTCLAALLVLSAVATERRVGLAIGLSLLALFGAGLGMFIAPNNSATMSAAPATLSGEAGGMLNLMRSLGTSLGVASASSMLSWRIQVLARAPSSAVMFKGHPLLGAVESCFAMLMVFAMFAGGVSFVRASRPAQPPGPLASPEPHSPSRPVTGLRE